MGCSIDVIVQLYKQNMVELSLSTRMDIAVWMPM